MRKYISFLTIVISFSMVQAQDINDGLLYSQDNTIGTARFRAMSGAFGALGGDLSSLNVNPAGSSVFANNQVTVTFNNANTKNNSDYFGKKTTDSQNSFDLNQAGVVFVFTNNNSDWKKFAIGINYENANNFDNSLFSAGTNPTNSIGNYFVNYANQSGVSVDNLILQPNETVKELYNFLGSNYGFPEQQALLGFQSYIIDTAADYDNNSNRSYVSLVPSGGNYYQENSIKSVGYNGKLSFNISGQYTDKLMLGLNLNSHFSDYRRSSSFFESNTNNTTTTDLVKRIYFNNELYTYGSGFSFQLGAIVKPTEGLRIGLAYESPTWYTLNDEFTQSVSATSGSTNGELPRDVADPETTNIYDPYNIQTPGKWTGSLAYVFGKKGLLSFDYGLKNYNNIIFSPERDFTSLNQEIIKNTRTNTSEYRVGGEYRIKQFSLRGGYHFEQSPYKNSVTIGNLTSYSGGIGYNFGDTKLDLAYVNSKREFNKSFFTTGLTDGAKINSITNNIVVTLAFEL
jgi:Outer membrane protein transport protein (OMPP1/FadL/TodX)